MRASQAWSKRRVTWSARESGSASGSFSRARSARSSAVRE